MALSLEPEALKGSSAGEAGMLLASIIDPNPHA